jgi:hypothetical protein
VTATHLSAQRFASALAARLDAHVPPPVRVFTGRSVPPLAEDDVTVRVVNGTEPWDALVVSEFQLEATDNESSLDVAADLAVTVLGFVQDRVVRVFREPWPRLSTGEIALPAARADDQRIHLWFGPSESRSAMTLPPIELAELTA